MSLIPQGKDARLPPARGAVDHAPHARFELRCALRIAPRLPHRIVNPGNLETWGVLKTQDGCARLSASRE